MAESLREKLCSICKQPIALAHPNWSNELKEKFTMRPDGAEQSLRELQRDLYSYDRDRLEPLLVRLEAEINDIRKTAECYESGSAMRQHLLEHTRSLAAIIGGKEK